MEILPCGGALPLLQHVKLHRQGSFAMHVLWLACSLRLDGNIIIGLRYDCGLRHLKTLASSSQALMFEVGSIVSSFLIR
eukprot:4507932-Amphidinium_carterae.2